MSFDAKNTKIIEVSTDNKGYKTALLYHQYKDRYAEEKGVQPRGEFIIARGFDEEKFQWDSGTYLYDMESAHLSWYKFKHKLDNHTQVHTMLAGISVDDIDEYFEECSDGDIDEITRQRAFHILQNDYDFITRCTDTIKEIVNEISPQREPATKTVSIAIGLPYLFKDITVPYNEDISQAMLNSYIAEHIDEIKSEINSDMNRFQEAAFTVELASNLNDDL